MDKSRLHEQPITTLSQWLQAGEISPVELTECLLARIEELDPHLNAYRLVCPERALDAANAAAAELAKGQSRGPLHGVPYAAKDLYDVAGLPTTAGSRVLKDAIAMRDAHVIRKLSDAGMILLGKTNTVQFAYGGVGINHDHGTPHNPWHRDHHVPGGSSSGSGVAVAAGMAPMALGSDTGGSVRIPAALCGTVGLKTTVGRIGRSGVYPLSWSLDSVGPLTRSVEDAARVYQCLQGPDPEDDTTRGRPGQDVLSQLKDGVKGLRLAFPEAVFWDETDPHVEAAVRACGAVFEALGAKVTSIPFPLATEALALNPGGLVIAAEAYTVNRALVDERFDDLDPIVAHRIVKGRDIPAHEYLQTSREWLRLRAKTAGSLEGVDALLCPTTMLPARPVEAIDASNESYSAHNLAYLRNTTIGNILDLCGLSLPCGRTEEGLPIGLMIYTKSFCEDMALRVGYAYEQQTGGYAELPSLDWT